MVLWIPPGLNVNRQPDGSVIAPDGTRVPPFAACAPDTVYDHAAGLCVAAPGARNIMYECGGLLAPWGSTPECIDDFAPAAHTAPVVSTAPQAAAANVAPSLLIAPLSFMGGPDYQAPRWADCNCKEAEPGSESRPHRADGACCGDCAGGSSAGNGGSCLDALMGSPVFWFVAGAAAVAVLKGGRR